MSRLRFRPTRRTLILIVGLVVAAVVGAVVLNRQRPAPPARPSPPTAEQTRAITQLGARAGVPVDLAYTEPRTFRGQSALCGFAGPHTQNIDRRRPARVYAFLSLPDRVLTSRDPDFAGLFGEACAGLPGAAPR